MSEETVTDDPPYDNETQDYFSTAANSSLSRSSRSRNAFRAKKSTSLPASLKYHSSLALTAQHPSPNTPEYEEIPLDHDRNPRFKYSKEPASESPSLRRSFIRRSSKRKITRPSSASSFRIKRDIFPTLPYLPSLENITNFTREFKYFVPERNSNIRRSLRTTIGSFRHLGKQKPVSVSGYVIQDRYISPQTWKNLSSLSPSSIRAKIKTENKVFDKCPRIIREHDVIQGSWKDLRSLGLFLRPYQPYFDRTQFTVRLIFRNFTYTLSEELYEGERSLTLCDIKEVRDVSRVLGEVLSVPKLTLCYHDACALSSLQYSLCSGVTYCF